MAIKDKDGKGYTLRGPNPLMKAQQEWDKTKIRLFNMRGGRHEEVITDLRNPVEAFKPLTWPDLKDGDRGNGSKRKTASHSAGMKINQNGYDVIQCRECGFWHVHPTPSREELDRYYQSVYYQNASEHGDMKDKNLDPDGYYRLKYEDKYANM